MSQPIPIQWLPHWRPEDRLVRNTPFTYACGACGRCCRDKVITVNPYEVARLARSQGMSTTRFLSEFTEGVALRRTAEGDCVFFGEGGCSVHPDRPLVCRLYPLGRRRTPEGHETFSHLEPHPQTAGRYSETGTVQDWLDSQGADPYIEATDAYIRAFHRLFEKLAAHEGGDGVTGWPESDDRGFRDIDFAIGESGAGASVEARMDAHIAWLDKQVV